MVATKELESLLTREAPRHVELGLSEPDLIEMYRTMVLSRRLDERMWVLQRQGKVAFHISCQGHEATQVGAVWALDRERDILHPYYRDIGMVLRFGVTPRELMLALFAKQGDVSSGSRQMPSHFSKKEARIISGSSPVATQIPQAAGIALASKIRGEDVVTLTCFGEGASSKGDFHEGLNFAGIWKLPVIFLCENNQYAISVHQSKQMAIENVADRAAGYGFPGVVVDGNDVLAVYEVTRRAVERARAGEGPTLIEAKTYRIVPHSSDDDDRVYRSRDEVEPWREERDPIRRFREYLLDHGVITEADVDEIEDEVMAIVNDATEFADEAPFAPPEYALERVYAATPKGWSPA
ncbi:MAG: thiamine pyrophosphate-dependent dehydrogenase E1 component subunit alpha [Chloroflexi bacterium]|nr:MAG: thiamine pyrophosphate-dependent dehydrogenase E1 component subunit alpha [Chloroflexota bacterium]